MSATIDLQPLVEFLIGTCLPASQVPWHLLRRDDVLVIRDWAGETQPLPVQQRLFAGLRRELRTAQGDDDDPAQTRTRPSLRPMRRRGAAAGLGARDARQLIESCLNADAAAAARDGALIALMLLAGLRRSEVARLQRGDYEDETRLLLVRTRGRPTRSVFLQGPSEELMDRWVQRRGGGPGPLFLALTAGGMPSAVGLHPASINRIVARRARLAGCSPMTPRDLRGRFLWQLQAQARREALALPCRYFQTEDGRAGWSIASLPSL